MIFFIVFFFSQCDPIYYIKWALVILNQAALYVVHRLPIHLDKMVEKSLKRLIAKKFPACILKNIDNKIVSI